MSEKRCATCAFYDKDATSDNEEWVKGRRCRRRAPGPASNGVQYSDGWAYVGEADWCGDWQATVDSCSDDTLHVTELKADVAKFRRAYKRALNLLQDLRHTGSLNGVHRRIDRELSTTWLVPDDDERQIPPDNANADPFPVHVNWEMLRERLAPGAVKQLRSTLKWLERQMTPANPEPVADKRSTAGAPPCPACGAKSVYEVSTCLTTGMTRYFCNQCKHDWEAPWQLPADSQAAPLRDDMVTMPINQRLLMKCPACDRGWEATIDGTTGAYVPAQDVEGRVLMVCTECGKQEPVSGPEADAASAIGDLTDKTTTWVEKAPRDVDKPACWNCEKPLTLDNTRILLDKWICAECAHTPAGRQLIFDRLFPNHRPTESKPSSTDETPNQP